MSNREHLEKLVKQVESTLEEIQELADELGEDARIETGDGTLMWNHGWQPSGGCEWEESGESGYWTY